MSALDEAREAYEQACRAWRISIVTGGRDQKRHAMTLALAEVLRLENEERADGKVD